MHQIIVLKLLFITVQFVLSFQWQNVKAFLSVTFSSQHLQGSDILFLLYSGGNSEMHEMKAVGNG